jgi:hypothetical protein
MPRYKDHEKNRLKNARLKKLSLLPKNKKLKRPSDPEQAKEWLRDVADHLSNRLNAGPGYRFVAYAIKRYLRDSKARDLHKELGLIYPPGKPRTFQERKEETDTARKIDVLIRAGETWPQVEEKLGMDRRTLERIYERHSARFRKEETRAPLDRAVREVLRERPKSS